MKPHLRAHVGYWVARQLRGWRWAVGQPKVWRWMEGQFARMAALGDPDAQSFYGHVLLFRGVGLGAREEGLRLLRLAAQAGDSRAAYQLGVNSLKGSVSQAPDAAEAARWFSLAAQEGHPLAARRLAELYRDGGPGLEPNPSQAAHYDACAAKLGL